MDSLPLQIAETLTESPGDLIFDMDGTLLEGDLGEGFYRERVSESEPDQALVELFAGRPWEDPNVLPIREGCMACSMALSGMTPDEIFARVDVWFSDGRVRIFDQVVEVVRMTRDAGHRPWLVTGSSIWIGRAVAQRVGIEAEHVIGVENVMVGGRLSSRIEEPVSAGAGKVLAWGKRMNTQPLLTIGDSRHDLPLMAASKFGGVLVYSEASADQDVLSAARALGFTCWPLVNAP